MTKTHTVVVRFSRQHYINKAKSLEKEKRKKKKKKKEKRKKRKKSLILLSLFWVVVWGADIIALFDWA